MVLQVPPPPLLIGDDITLTCRVRGNKRVTEAVFFKDGLELQRQPKPNLHLSHFTKEDQGVYWCRATWWQGFLWHTSQSLPVEVPVNGMPSLMLAYEKGVGLWENAVSVYFHPNPGCTVLQRY